MGSIFFLFILNKLMKIKNKLILFTLLLCFVTSAKSQNGFVFKDGNIKDKVKFELINSLVVIPVTIYGKKRFFILDSGVKSTILFGLTQEDSLLLKNTTIVKLRGLGGGANIEAIKTTNNSISIGNIVDTNHTFYVVNDKTFNLSKKMGIPIYGIIGYEFFKNFVVKFNYNSKKIFLYKEDEYQYKTCKKCEEFNLTFYKGKPFFTIDVVNLKNEFKNVKVLIDMGSSDALWLFDETQFIKNKPQKNYFEDYLGQGLNGNIFGKRSKIAYVNIGNFKLTQVKAAFPDTQHFSNITFVNGRDGSIGNELLKRFTVIIDYPRKKLILKKNSKFKEPFHYNMSGLTIEHEGVEIVKEKHQKIKNSDDVSKSNDVIDLFVNEVVDFYLVPKYVVTDVRKSSPADLAGIQKGDEVLSINNKPAYHYKLAQLVQMFSSKEDKHITIIIRRNGVISKKRFILKKVL